MVPEIVDDVRQLSRAKLFFIILCLGAAVVIIAYLILRTLRKVGLPSASSSRSQPLRGRRACQAGT